jgi:SAM-dependent methyltransferase
MTVGWELLRHLNRALGRAMTGRPSATPAHPAQLLDAYRREIDRFNAGEPNRNLLDAIRQYNHDTIDALNQMRPLEGLSLLDVGASPHGYALEWALTRRAARYVGVGLDVSEPLLVRAETGFGELLNVDGEKLPFEDQTFDLVISMSTFEHVRRVDRVLAEIRRVTKPRGAVLITFEPIWTCAYGHHLHHFGPVSQLMPAWAHLVWSKDRMLRELRTTWPADAPLSLKEAAEYVYDEPGLNRIGIREMLRFFNGSSLAVDWIQPLMDEPRDTVRRDVTARETGLTSDELMTKGLSVFMHR